MKNATIKAPPALPATTHDLQRYLKEMPSLNDEVERIFRKLWDTSPEFKQCLYATHNVQAITGSLSWDSYDAVRFIIEEARSDDNRLILEEKPFAIGKSLNTVCRRYHIDRQTRRNMVGDESVPGDNNDAEGSE